jgi:hypothetical protein
MPQPGSPVLEAHGGGELGADSDSAQLHAAYWIK